MSERIRLLFVCIGNICRSPMAAGLARKMLGGRGTAASAGIAPFGDRASLETIRVMREEGIDLSDHQPTDVTRVILDDYDCVVAMEAAVSRYLRFTCRVPEHKLISWEIPDPFGHGSAVYGTCREVIQSHVRDLLDRLRPVADAGDGR